MITEVARTVVDMLGNSEWSSSLLCYVGSSSFVIELYCSHLSGIIEDCFLCFAWVYVSHFFPSFKCVLMFIFFVFHYRGEIVAFKINSVCVCVYQEYIYMSASAHGNQA